ncbi:MAG TPA: carboxypeptidase-like regulatory domain-containing protein [Chitinophagaceae bacterium]|nr:carboxypeptidase-like regulatory domain-containing protein [Chitinophagaceae bacterium]
MKKTFLFLILVIVANLHSKAQFGFDNMVELTGVVMSADSLRYLPYVTVSIPSSRSGTTTTEKGVFTMIAEKGDTLEFTSVGYRKKRYIIPLDLTSSRYSIIQLMSQDTFYLSPTIIRPRISREEFDKAFRTMDIPDDKLEIARKNTEYQTMRMMLAILPRDGRENQHTYQNMVAQKNYWAGQQPPMTIFSPLAWSEFFKAWKRGDFRRKK